jgi:hypothetical protein
LVSVAMIGIILQDYARSRRDGWRAKRARHSSRD